MNRRNLLQMAACGGLYSMLSAPDDLADGSASPADTPHVEPFEWEEATIAQLKAAMDSGKETAASLARKYLQRIAAIDKANRNKSGCSGGGPGTR